MGLVMMAAVLPVSVSASATSGPVTVTSDTFLTEDARGTVELAAFGVTLGGAEGGRSTSCSVSGRGRRLLDGRHPCMLD